jgi:putative flippase GtrA
MSPVNFSKIIGTIIKMIQFGCVGGLMVILNVEIIYLLTSILGIYYLISAILSYLMLTALSFFLNEKWTFNSVADHAHEKLWHRLASYYLVSLSGMSINIIILFLLTNFENVYYLYSSIIASCSVFFWNFFVNKKITWGEKHNR